MSSAGKEDWDGANRGNAQAQLEMIGLIVIVILVITALLIYTVYKVTTPSENIQREYMNKEIATNLLVSMTKTDIRECHNLSLATLITDCAKVYSTTICSNDLTSCDVANKTIYNILNKTLIDWDVSFNFSIQSRYQGIFINFVNLDCDSNAKNKIQSFQILPLGFNESAAITLDICE